MFKLDYLKKYVAQSRCIMCKIELLKRALVITRVIHLKIKHY